MAVTSWFLLPRYREFKQTSSFNPLSRSPHRLQLPMVVGRACVVSGGGRGQIPMVWIWLPTRISHKSDQGLKVESVCTLQQVWLTFLVKPFIKLCIVLPLCPQTLCYILMSIRSVRLTAKGRWRGLGQHYPISGPATHWKKGREVYTTTVWWLAGQ